MTSRFPKFRNLVFCLCGAIAFAIVLAWLCQPGSSARAQQGAEELPPLQLGPPSALPQGSPASSPQATESVVRAYTVAGANAVDVAARLQAAYANRPDVRIAADARTAQIVVLAPGSVHDAIAQQIKNETMAGGGNATAQNPAPAAKSNLEVQRTVNLRNLRSSDFPVALQQLWGRALPQLAPPTAERASFAFDAEGGRHLTLEVDHGTGQITLRGPEYLVDSWLHVVEALDSPPATPDRSTRVVSYQRSDPNSIRKALGAILRSSASVAKGAAPGGRDASLLTMLFQPQRGGEQLAQAPAAPPAVAAQPAADDDTVGGLSGPVQIEFLEGLDIVVVRGHPRDVQRVTQIIQDIERLSAETVPQVEIYPLKNIGADQAASFVRTLYDQSLAARQGSVSITSLVKPNAVLLVGRAESVQSVIDLIQKLDQPVTPVGQFRVFPLQHASATSAQTTVQEFFASRLGGLAGRVQVTADVRGNTLIAQGSPRDLEELAVLLKSIDVETSAAVNELRVFPLRNSLAEDLAPILQDAINAQSATSVQRRGGQGQQQPQQQPQQAPQGGQGQPQQQPQAQQQGGQSAQAQATRSAVLRFMTIDAQGEQRFKSGILSDVKITADPRANALLISAPAESMELLTALVRQLDQIPASESQIKVFTIVNGDASNLATMLEGLFGITSTRTGPGGGGGAAAVLQALSGAGSDGSLVQLRFTVDQRTNSIIASGSKADLSVVEAILLRLDESDVRQRKNNVYRLKNAPALDVSNSINQFLRSQIQVQQIQPGLLSPFEQIEREVIVVPEPVSNSLIISATPRYFDEIMRVIKELDERPPMVMIQVLIAEVALNNVDEFGIELGLQSSVLFDRSLLGDLVTQTTTTTFGNPPTTVEQQNIVGASNTPGFAFNTPGAALGNSGSDQAKGGASNVGKQALTNFGVGRINNQLGFGGLVLSASSENVSALLRALRECRRMDVLSRPQVMTLDNQAAFIQVGQRVPRITNVQFTATGQINNTTLDNVGLIMYVRPRISPDGLVVMQIDAERSDVAPEAEGIPISISVTGQVIRSPRINVITAQTTVSALSGQTVVLGGLITKNQSDVHRRVPVLSNIPILGQLFRYDSVDQRRTELLIILTPRVVRSEEEAEEIKRVEASRMSWCLGDVNRLHGESGLRGRTADWDDAETMVIYPDHNPTGNHNLPTPAQGLPPGSVLPPGVTVPSGPGAPRGPIVPQGGVMAPPDPLGKSNGAVPIPTNDAARAQPVPTTPTAPPNPFPSVMAEGPREPLPQPAAQQQTEVRFRPPEQGAASQWAPPPVGGPASNAPPSRPATPVLESAGGAVPFNGPMPPGQIVPAQYQWPVPTQQPPQQFQPPPQQQPINPLR